MGEIASSWSPYNYVENNTLINSDPTGMYSEDALFNAAKNDPNTKNVYTANGYGTGSENEETREITRNKEGKPTGVRIGFGNATENQDCCPGPCCPYDKFDRSQEAILSMSKEERLLAAEIFVSAATLWVPIKINLIPKLRLFNFAAKGVGRIQAKSVRDIGKLANKLSQYESRLGLDELKALEKLVGKHGGNLRYDLNPVKGSFKHPHVQIENLTPSIQRRHIWLGDDALKYLKSK